MSSLLSFRYPDKPILSDPAVIAKLNPADWIVQKKYDGHRMPVFIDGANSIRCMTSHREMMAKTWTKFPAAVIDEFISWGLPDNTFVDCEMMGPRGSHAPQVIILDLLAFNGQWLVSEPYQDRWQRCVDLYAKLPFPAMIKLADTIFPTTAQEITDYFMALKNDWIDRGRGMNYAYEGIVLKMKSGKPTLNISSSAKAKWLYKIKFRNMDKAL